MHTIESGSNPPLWGNVTEEAVAYDFQAHPDQDFNFTDILQSIIYNYIFLWIKDHLIMM